MGWRRVETEDAALSLSLFRGGLPPDGPVLCLPGLGVRLRLPERSRLLVSPSSQGGFKILPSCFMSM